jgi:uncharacterized protein YcfL
MRKLFIIGLFALMAVAANAQDNNFVIDEHTAVVMTDPQNELSRQDW